MASPVCLREVTEADLAVFFEHQLDPVAVQMAAFTSKDPSDRQAFMARWAKILGDSVTKKRTILLDGKVVGHIVGFQRSGSPEVTYWIGREYWGRGIATRALSMFLGEYELRPLFARAAKDNLASIRVLEKCGFKLVGQERGFSNARGEEIEEGVLRLE